MRQLHETAPPRKPGQPFGRTARRLAGRTIVASGVMALALLIAAPERHAPCAGCNLLTSGQLASLGLQFWAGCTDFPVDDSGWIQLGKRGDVAPFRALQGMRWMRCDCDRHPGAEEWHAVLTGAAGKFPFGGGVTGVQLRAIGSVTVSQKR